jgi:hypothetical protein
MIVIVGIFTCTSVVLTTVLDCLHKDYDGYRRSFQRVGYIG